MSDLAGRVALVTGAGKGIGAAIAERLAREGAAVAVNSLGASGAEATAARLAAAGGEAAPFPADVADPRAVESMFAAIGAWRGPVEVLVNNAGILEMAPLADMELALWHRVLAVNLDGVFHCIRAVVPGMLAAGRGRIVNVTSIWGLVGVAGASHYCASKGGIVGLTRALGEELGPRGVRVVALAPGTVDTEQLRADAAFAGISLEEMKARYAADTLLARIGTPEEIAGLVVRLAGDEGEGLDGRTVAATGGRRIE